MERSYKKVCAKHLDELNEENMVEVFEAYEEYATHGLRAKKFITYDDSIVRKLRNVATRKSISKKLNIPIDKNTSRFILKEEEASKKFTSMICGKMKRELFEEGYCDVPSSTPITTN